MLNKHQDVSTCVLQNYPAWENLLMENRERRMCHGSIFKRVRDLNAGASSKKARMWFWLTKNNKCSIMLSAWLLFVLCVMLGPVRGRVCHACVTEVSRVRHGSVTRVSRKDFRGPKTHKHAVWTQSTYNSSKSANESRKHVLCINFPFLSIQNHIQLFYSDSRLSESHTTFWTSNVS